MKIFLAFILLSMACTGVARSAPVAYEIDMLVTNASGSAFGGVAIGSVFTATLEIDPLVSTGELAGPPGYDWLAGANFLVDLNGTIIDQNLFPFTSNVDDFFVAANTWCCNDVFPADDPNGFLDLLIRINMSGSTNDAVVNDGYVGIAFSGESQTDTTWGAIDTTGGKLTGTFDIHVAAVPVPASVWLFGSALVGLGWIRRKMAV